MDRNNCKKKRKSSNSVNDHINYEHSDSSYKSSPSSNEGTLYNLEYCTSTSTLSPSPKKIAKTQKKYSEYRKTSANSLEIINALNSSNSSRLSASPASSLLFRNGFAPRHNRKRKRSTVNKYDDLDSEVGLEPTAKRTNGFSTIYNEESSSVVSSVYPSPAENFLNDPSSSECLSVGYDIDDTDDGGNDVIPDSPNEETEESCDQDPDDDDDNDEDEDDDEVVSGTTSPSASSAASSKVLKDSEYIILEKHLKEVNTNNSKSRVSEKQLITNVDQRDHHECFGECTPNERRNSTEKVKSFLDYAADHYNCMTPGSISDMNRQCPLPALSWANAHDVWQLMCKKDEVAADMRCASMLDNHPGLQPRMRAILLDWLIEVCEVYKLQRETYFLAVDYLDRYLAVQKKVQKTHLQLIGITCLFVAAKVEEIYPPKLSEFAYVTDGACQDSHILNHEVLLLQALDWNISTVTPMSWLGIYMQLNVNNRSPASLGASISATLANKNRNATDPSTNIDDAFIYPQFSGFEYAQTSQLLDLCSLDVNMSDFPYSVIAAAAMSHTFNREIAQRCSGLDWESIEPCAQWMKPFFQVVYEDASNLRLMEQNEQTSSKFGLGHICPNIVTDDSHIIQTHTISMAMFDRVHLLKEQHLNELAKMKQITSPANGFVCPNGMLTPPASNRKNGDINDNQVEHVSKQPEIDRDNRDHHQVNRKQKNLKQSTISVTNQNYNTGKKNAPAER